MTTEHRAPNGNRILSKLHSITQYHCLTAETMDLISKHYYMAIYKQHCGVKDVSVSGVKGIGPKPHKLAAIHPCGILKMAQQYSWYTRAKLLTAETTKEQAYWWTSVQFNLEAEPDKPLINNSTTLPSGFYRQATNALELETNIRTLATARTLITAYQTPPTSLAFISNFKQHIFAGCHGNYSLPHLLACQLMTFISNGLLFSAGNVLSYLHYTTPLATK